MSSRREFLTKTLGFASLAIIGGESLADLKFDSSKSIKTGKSDIKNSKDYIEVAGQCGMGMGCGGGGGQCGFGMGCGGGGGHCGFGMGCSGG